jgi:hypothetical protein
VVIAPEFDHANAVQVEIVAERGTNLFISDSSDRAQIEALNEDYNGAQATLDRENKSAFFKAEFVLVCSTMWEVIIAPEVDRVGLPGASRECSGSMCLLNHAHMARILNSRSTFFFF